jgi:hypothetical protein
VLDEVDAALRRQGFGVSRVTDMDGWLLYHSIFVASVAAALYRCGTDSDPPERPWVSCALLHMLVTLAERCKALATQSLPGSAISHGPSISAGCSSRQAHEPLAVTVLTVVALRLQSAGPGPLSWPIRTLSISALHCSLHAAQSRASSRRPAGTRASDSWPPQAHPGVACNLHLQ